MILGLMLAFAFQFEASETSDDPVFKSSKTAYDKTVGVALVAVGRFLHCMASSL